MAAIQRANANWKESAIERSESITDAWEVTKTYAGRFAEWVLFVCMVMNIIEILPGVQMWNWLVNAVLGIQAVTLDVAGFGLATMAEQARLAGQEDTARRAKQTAYVLIGLMMITVLSISVGTLWPAYKAYTDLADKILILIRVAMTVWYGHVLHDLRQQTVNVLSTSVIEERLNLLTERVSQLRPQDVNYEMLAAKIVPLLPQPERVNIDWIMSTVLTEMRQLQAQKEETVASALSALQATLEAFVSATKEQQVASTCNVVDISEYREEVTVDAPSEETKVSTRRATATSPAKQKAQRILKRNPNISATELATKAGISRQYASKIMAEIISA